MRVAPALQVWSAAVRLLHWGLVLAVAVATLGLWWLGGAHQPAGYVALGIALTRLVWGLVARPGSYVAFAQFVRSPGAAWTYLRAVRQGHEPRYIGHNPLGGWMVLALLLCVAGLGLTGWLYTTDRYWGDETVERVHVALAWTLLALVVLHVGGVVFTSLRHRENLVAAMINGRKRP